MYMWLSSRWLLEAMSRMANPPLLALLQPHKFTFDTLTSL